MDFEASAFELLAGESMQAGHFLRKGKQSSGDSSCACVKMRQGKG